MPTLRGMIRPGRRANQLAAYSQPLTARQNAQPDFSWSPSKRQTKKLGSFAQGADRQAARQGMRQDARQQSRNPDMGYNPLGSYGATDNPETTFASELRANPAGYYKWKPKLGDITGPAANYGNTMMFTLGEAGEKLDRAVTRAMAGPKGAEKLENWFTHLGKDQTKQAIAAGKQGGYLGDDQRDYLRNMGFKISPFKPGSIYRTDASSRGSLTGSPTATPAANAGVAAETGLTVQSATDAIKAKAEAMGLPLTPEFEAQMRVYEDQLSAELAQLGVAQEQIKPMVDLAMERMATQQGIDTSALREGLVERGIYDSGTTTRDWSRLNADYSRQGQDIAMNAAQQYSDIAAQQGEAYLNFQQQTIEALLQRALDAAQNVPLGLPQWGYEGVTGTRSATRAARRRDRRQDRRRDRRADNG